MSMDNDPGRAHRFLVDRMRSIETIVTEWVNEQVARAGVTGLRTAHGRVMAELGAGSRPSDLAKRLGVTKGAVGQLVDRLEAAGFVTREPDPVDGRAHVVRPTQKAGAAYRVSRQSLIAIEEEWRQLLGPEAMESLGRALEVLDGWRPKDAQDRPSKDA